MLPERSSNHDSWKFSPERFNADLESGRRILSLAAPERKLAVFSQFAREGIRWSRVLPKPDVIDALRELALDAGIDDTEIQNALLDAVERPFNPDLAKATPAKLFPHWRSRCSTAAALQTMAFPPVSYVVPALLPEGLTIFAGRPKIGKSWMALDLCLAVAGGVACLGAGKAETGDVLYVALEDNARRLRRRIGKVVGDAAWPGRLTLATEWRRLDQGGLDDLAEWISSATRPRLIALDTLARIKAIRPTSGYGEDYESLAGLQRLANDHEIAILVLHHTRKMGADDPLDTVSGTLGLAGCADTVLVIARSAKGATLYSRGRDVEEAERAVQFDKEACRWTILGQADEVQRSEERQRIIAVIADGETPVADIVGATGMKRNNLDKLLHMMVKDGDIMRIKRGVYGTAPERR